MFHITWATFKFSGNQLGMVSAYVMSSMPWSNQRAHYVISEKLLSKEFHCRAKDPLHNSYLSMLIACQDLCRKKLLLDVELSGSSSEAAHPMTFSVLEIIMTYLMRIYVTPTLYYWGYFSWGDFTCYVLRFPF